MSNLGAWLAGALMVVLALLGLLVMSRAVDPMFGFFGLLLFLFGVAVVVVMVHKATDHSAKASEAEQA